MAGDLNQTVSNDTKKIAAGASTGAKAISAVKKGQTAIGIFGSISIFPAIIVGFILITICVLVGGISNAQMAKTYYLTPTGENIEIKTPTGEAKKEAIWEAGTAIAQTSKLMAIIDEYKTSRLEKDAYSEIENTCSKIGADYTTSLGYASIETSYNDSSTYLDLSEINESTAQNESSTDNTSNSSSKKEGKVLQTFDISGGDKIQLENYTAESIYQQWMTSMTQGKLYAQKSKWYIDKNGFAKWKNDDGTEDYMIALGSYFGIPGNRYRLKFKNGTVITALVFDAKGNSDTVAPASQFKAPGYKMYQYNDAQIKTLYGVGSGFSGHCSWSEIKAHPSYGSKPYYSGILEFITKDGLISNSSIFSGGLKSVELIEGTLTSNISNSTSMPNLRLLSAYSISIENMQLTVEKETKYSHKAKMNITVYKTKNGTEIPIIQSGDEAGQIDFKQDITDKLDKYDGKFYEVDYERDTDGNIKIYTLTIEGKDEGDEKKESGTNSSSKDKNKETGSEKPKIVRYIIPVIREKEIDSISEELFGLDPNKKYINSSKSQKVTNSEAIDTLAANTSSLLYGTDGSGESITGVSIGGKFCFPTVTSGYTITSYFGYRSAGETSGVGSTNHQGIDIAASANSPIFAAEDGTVTQAGWYGGYGNCVQIDHGNGIKTLYGHQSTILVHKGQKVTKGQQIGRMGNTGNSTGTHLHFGLYINNSPIDPIKYITK